MPNPARYGRKYAPTGFQQITSLSSATALSVPSDTTAALISVTDQNVRWRDDGTSPTASVGMQLLVGATFFFDGDLSKIKFIEETTSAKINVSYYKEE